jgi:hypothetical protein
LKFKISFKSTFLTGMVMGVSAAAAQAFFKVQPPVADGISFLGHPAYLLKWGANHVFGTEWSIAPEFAVFPALTVIGVLIGSFVASGNMELKLKPGPVRQKFLSLIYGFLVVNFGLFWGACPIRTALLVSYGSILALTAFTAIIVGVLLAIFYLRMRGKRGAVQ